MGKIKALFHRCRKSMAFRLWALCFISVAYFYPGGGQNEAARYDAIRAYWLQHNAIVDMYVYNSADVILMNGHYYSGKAPGTFFVGVPVYGFFDTVLKIFPLSTNLHDHILCYLISLFTVGLMGTLCAPLIFFFLRRKGFSEEESVIVSLTIFFGTILFPWSSVFFSHAATAFWIFLAFYQIFVFFQESRASRPKNDLTRLLIAGFSLAMAVDFEYPSAIAASFLAVYGLSYWWPEKRRYEAGAALGGVVLGILPLLIYNQWAFHKMFFVPYEAYASDPTTTFTAHKHGILGIRLPIFEPEFWPTFLHNFAEITWHPLRGLFYANPILVLILPGFFLFFRLRKWRDREAILALALFVGYLIFNASYGDSVVYWGGGTSFGPRHLTTVLPFLALPLAMALQRPLLRQVFVRLAVVSAIFCLMATSIEPRTPYAPNDPIFQYYVPHFFAGDFSLTKEGIFSREPASDHGVAFNAGMALGLPHQFQLVPLALLWVLFGFWLDRGLKRTKFRIVALALAVVLVLPIFTH